MSVIVLALGSLCKQNSLVPASTQLHVCQRRQTIKQVITQKVWWLSGKGKKAQDSQQGDLYSEDP